MFLKRFGFLTLLAGITLTVLATAEIDNTFRVIKAEEFLERFDQNDERFMEVRLVRNLFFDSTVQVEKSAYAMLLARSMYRMLSQNIEDVNVDDLNEQSLIPDLERLSLDYLKAAKPDKQMFTVEDYSQDIHGESLLYRFLSQKADQEETGDSKSDL